MAPISKDLEEELTKRLESSGYHSLDALIRDALRALDNAEESSRALLERALLEGLKGDTVELTSAEWDRIEAEALARIEAKKSR
jgi:Arc/MetJ-type ribon-helix-helix transcriptional regulator